MLLFSIQHIQNNKSLLDEAASPQNFVRRVIRLNNPLAKSPELSCIYTEKAVTKRLPTIPLIQEEDNDNIKKTND